MSCCERIVQHEGRAARVPERLRVDQSHTTKAPCKPSIRCRGGGRTRKPPSPRVHFEPRKRLASSQGCLLSVLLTRPNRKSGNVSRRQGDCILRTRTRRSHLGKRSKGVWNTWKQQELGRQPSLENDPSTIHDDGS